MLVSQHQLGKSGALYSAWRFITCNQWQTLTPKSWGSVFWCLLNFFSLLVWILFSGEWNLAHVFVITKCGSSYSTCLNFKHKRKDLIFRNFSTIISSVYVYVAPGLWFSDLDVADVTLCFACSSYYSVCCKHWVTGISRVGVFPVAGIQCPFYSGFSSLGWGCGCGLDWWAGGGGPGRWINNKLQFWEEGQLLIPW